MIGAMAVCFSLNLGHTGVDSARAAAGCGCEEGRRCRPPLASRPSCCAGGRYPACRATPSRRPSGRSAPSSCRTTSFCTRGWCCRAACLARRRAASTSRSGTRGSSRRSRCSSPSTSTSPWSPPTTRASLTPRAPRSPTGRRRACLRARPIRPSPRTTATGRAEERACAASSAFSPRGTRSRRASGRLRSTCGPSGCSPRARRRRWCARTRDRSSWAAASSSPSRRGAAHTSSSAGQQLRPSPPLAPPRLAAPAARQLTPSATHRKRVALTRSLALGPALLVAAYTAPNPALFSNINEYLNVLQSAALPLAPASHSPAPSHA